VCFLSSVGRHLEGLDILIKGRLVRVRHHDSGVVVEVCCNVV
jgi:hypothetical protein